MSAAEALPPRTRPGRRRRWVWWSVLAVVVLLVVCAAVLAWQTLKARDALTAALDEVPAAEEALRSGDRAAAEAALARLQPLTATARSNTDNPLWAVAAHLPFFGRDVHAVRVMAAVADEIAADVLPPLTEVTGIATGDALTVRDGAIDLAPLEAAAPHVAEAARAVEGIEARLATVDPRRLHIEVAEPFDRLVTGTETLRSTVRTADRVVALAPGMLGAEGPRRYLVVAMNSAELRAGGGIPGAFAVISTDDGRIVLEQQASTQDVGPFAAPVADLDPGDVEMYSERMGMFVQDTTMTPDFPTAASLTSRMWELSSGETVDGVVATDPVALSYLLQATGPVTVGGVTLDAGSVVQTLLSTSYAVLDGSQTDTFFSLVAAQVIGSALSGAADPVAAREALDRASSEHRLLMWSSHDDEQKRLEDTVVSGAIDTSPRAAGSVGVFLNDATGGKMDYYLGSDVRIADTRCTADGRVDTFEVDLISSAPADAATSLPWYVTGGGISGVDPGIIRTQVVLYPPRGGEISDVTVDDASAVARLSEIDGRAALALPQDLAPGQTATLRFSATTPDPTDRTPATAVPETSEIRHADVWSTPTTSSPGLQVFPIANCD